MTPDQALAREIALLKRAQKDPTFGWPVIRGGALAKAQGASQ